MVEWLRGIMTRGIFAPAAVRLRAMIKPALLFLFSLFALFQPGKSTAEQSVQQTAAICEAAAHQASIESGVPVSVLMAITLTETGKRRGTEILPWPWTVNMEGKGVWFDDLEEAKIYVDAHFARGARSFDVGCFQINFRWHGDAFSSISEMFEPLANARYAAKFLGELYDEFGDWSKAAGAYHSRTPHFANRYRARFDRFRARLGEIEPEFETAQVALAPETGSPATPANRVNLFPLLQNSDAIRAPGSLVPLWRSPASGQTMIGGEIRG